MKNLAFVIVLAAVLSARKKLGGNVLTVQDYRVAIYVATQGQSTSLTLAKST